MNNDIKEEMIYFSRQFANMFGIPVRICCNDEIIYFYSPVNLNTDPVVLCYDEIIKKKEEISYFIYDELFYYGIVNHQNYKFVIGPASELPISDNEMKKYAFLLNISESEVFMFISNMRLLSGFHLDTLIQAIIIYNFTINKTMYDISDVRIKNSEQNNISSLIKESEVSAMKDYDFYSNAVRSFSIEKDIIKKIINGDVEGLIDGATKIPAVSSGNLAPHLIRHQKNFFIRLETIVSRTAIEAGLDVEEVFSAEQMYIKKCESLENIDRIKNLQYHMILDFADRVRKLHQYNEANSKLVNNISKYINNHITEPVKTADIADYLGKSRGTVTTEFKKQTGMNLSYFIKLKKIQKSEEILNETNKSLIFISNYLGFSSQAHFCKVFKQIKGITPKEYRDKKQI